MIYAALKRPLFHGCTSILECFSKPLVLFVSVEAESVFNIETEREVDGRWIAEIVDIPGILAYGTTESEARSKANVLARRVLGEGSNEEKE